MHSTMTLKHALFAVCMFRIWLLHAADNAVSVVGRLVARGGASGGGQRRPRRQRQRLHEAHGSKQVIYVSPEI